MLRLDTKPCRSFLVPLALTTLVTAEKRVMAYTMSGPQANRGKMARHPLAVTTLVKAGKRVMS
jgi:hypothetical protein